MTRKLSGFKRTFNSIRSSSDDKNINVSPTLNFSSDYLENNNTENSIEDPIILNNNFENVKNMSDNDYFYKSSEDDDESVRSEENESVSSFSTEASDDLISIDENSYKFKANKRQKYYCDVCDRSFVSNLSRHEQTVAHKENLRLLNEKDNKHDNEENNQQNNDLEYETNSLNQIRIQKPIYRYNKFHCEICDKDFCISAKQVHEKSIGHKKNKILFNRKNRIREPVSTSFSADPSVDPSTAPVVPTTTSSNSHTSTKLKKYFCEYCNKYIAISFKNYHENSAGHKEAINASSEKSENSTLCDTIDTLDDGFYHSNRSNKYTDEDIDAMMNKIDDLTSKNNSLEKKINDLEKRFNSFKDFMKKL